MNLRISIKLLLPEAFGPTKTVSGSNSNSAASMLRKSWAHTLVINLVFWSAIAMMPLALDFVQKLDKL